MDKERIRYLVEKFGKGILSPEEESELERLISEGHIHISEFPSLADMDRSLESFRIPDPGGEMDSTFYDMLKKRTRSVKTNFLTDLQEWLMHFINGLLNNRVAYPALMVAAGFILGLVLSFRSGQKQINALNSQINEIHEMLVVNLLEKPDATERLRAVSLTMDMKSADDKVINALLNTLGHDENVNVRLAAIDALYKYAGNERVREGFITALEFQDSPIVLVTLADVLVSLQEKGSIDKLRQLLNNKNLNEQVKDKIRTSINKMS